MKTTLPCSSLPGYLRTSVARISREINPLDCKRADPLICEQHFLMRALRRNPFDLQKASAIAGRASAKTLEKAFSSEVIGVREAAEVAENIINIKLQTEVFSWALNYSVRSVSRIAAILEATHHSLRIAPAIARELENCGNSPHVPVKQVVASLFYNPNMSREKRLVIANFLSPKMMADLKDTVEASLDREKLPKRAAFFGIPLCAGSFAETREALLEKADELSPEDLASQLLSVNDIYLERGVLSPRVMPIGLSAQIINNLPESNAINILIGMSTGTLWDYFRFAGFSEEEASRLLRFGLD